METRDSMSYRRNNHFDLNSVITFMLSAIMVAVVVIFGPSFYNKYISTNTKPTIITSSMLEDAVKISKLSTAKYKYNGIAQVYEDEKVKCNIKYNAEVKAGINMNDIKFDIDDNNKVIKVSLPEIQLSAYIIDENSLSFIPSNSKVDLKEAISACENDSLEEAKASDELIDTAQENLKRTVQALLYPLLETMGYTMEWK